MSSNLPKYQWFFFQDFCPILWKRSNQKSSVRESKWNPLISSIKCYIYSFDLSLEARAEILERFSFVFWKIWRHLKEILELLTFTTPSLIIFHLGKTKISREAEAASVWSHDGIKEILKSNPLFRRFSPWGQFWEWILHNHKSKSPFCGFFLLKISYVYRQTHFTNISWFYLIKVKLFGDIWPYTLSAPGL